MKIACKWPPSQKTNVGFSELFTFSIQSAFNLLPKKVSFILDPRRTRQYLPVCHRVGTNLGTSGFAPLP